MRPFPSAAEAPRKSEGWLAGLKPGDAHGTTQPSKRGSSPILGELRLLLLLGGPPHVLRALPTRPSFCPLPK